MNHLQSIRVAVFGQIPGFAARELKFFDINKFRFFVKHRYAKRCSLKNTEVSSKR